MTKERLLALLEESRGSFVSGERIASLLSVSRAAVSKAAASLRQDGYDIESVTGIGYRIDTQSPVLSVPLIKKYLKSDYTITLKNETGSTNTDLRKIAENANPFTVIAARQQTGGKGRMGRQFHSPEGSGFYFSILLRPSESAEDATFITAAAAVAVACAIESVCSEQALIKWVNDVFVRDKKVCGILTEAAFDMENGRFSYVVLGIGLNLCMPEGGFPDNIKDIAGCIFSSTVSADKKAELIAAVLDNFYKLYHNRSTLFSEYRERCFVIGRSVSVIRGSETYRASITGLDEKFRLLVRRLDGTDEVLSSGEISLKL